MCEHENHLPFLKRCVELSLGGRFLVSSGFFCNFTKKITDVMKVYKLLSYKLTHRDAGFTMKQILIRNG